MLCLLMQIYEPTSLLCEENSEYSILSHSATYIKEYHPPLLRQGTDRRESMLVGSRRTNRANDRDMVFKMTVGCFK